MTTVAGTGEQWRPGDAVSGPALSVRLSTPWDVCVWDGAVVVAMAGTHQLWTYDGTSVGVLAGTTGEGLRDGDALKAYLAQPSGLAAGADRLWFADAETSALRWYRDGSIGTAVGTGLFDFGHRDGPAADALLQHPLGVAVLPDGSVAVCDTYNDAVRRYDPVTGEVTTLATDVREPSGAVVVDGDLVVVASAAHRLERPVAPGAMRRVQGQAQQTQRPAHGRRAGAGRAGGGLRAAGRSAPRREVRPGDPPGGDRLAGGAAGLRRRRLDRPDALAGAGVRRAVGGAARRGDGGLLRRSDRRGEHPACHITQQDWGIPLELVAGGSPRVALVLRGLDT